MSFGLGILAGIGRGQRAYNDRAHDENLASERSKNEAAVKLYQDFMLRDDVTPETRSAALRAFTQHAQVKGMPTSKDRQAGMDLILGAFDTPRDFTSPAVAAARQQGARDTSTGEGMIGAAVGGNQFFPSIPAFGSPGVDLTRRGAEESATPSETRRGFYRSDEIGAMKGRAAGTQTRAMIDAMGMGGVGSAIPGPNGSMFVIGPDGKDRLVNQSIANENYQSPDGTIRNRLMDHRTGRMVDSETGEPAIGPRWSPGGYSNVSTLDADGNPVTQRVSRLEGGTFEKPVTQRVIRVKHADNTESFHSYNPITNEVGPELERGVVQTAPQLARTEAGTTATTTGTDIKKKMYALNYDPTAFPGGVDAAPPGLPIVNGQITGLKQFAATKEPGSVLQRASTGRVVVQHSEDTAKMVEDPGNAEFFGKVSGRVSELLTEGPTMFGKKVFGPIGTSDARLTRLHGAIKSISDLLTTVHGRRAEESARNFERSLSMANSPAALAAIIRQYAKIAEEVAAEGERPIVPISGSGTSRVPATPTGTTGTATPSTATATATTATGTSTTPAPPNTKELLRALAARIANEGNGSLPAAAAPSTPAAAPPATSTSVPAMPKTPPFVEPKLQSSSTPAPASTPVPAPISVPTPAPAARSSASTSTSSSRLYPTDQSDSIRWEPTYIRSANNNPMNIKIGALTQKWIDSGNATKDPVVAGDGGHYVRFNSVDAGIDAARDLLLSSGYRALSVDDATKKWSSGGYDARELTIPELGPKLVSDLTRDEMDRLLARMAQHESGYRVVRSEAPTTRGTASTMRKSPPSRVPTFTARK